MKMIAGLLLVSLLTACSSATNPVSRAGVQGVIEVEQLVDDYPDFSDEYHRFQPTERDFQRMRKLEGKSILVLFGLWCHDSQREVPRLIKLVQGSRVKLTKLTLLAVDANKQESSGLAKKMSLRYTPTIILLQEDHELGRIVEKPTRSLSEDLISMLKSDD